MARPLVVRVGDLLRDPGSRRTIDRSAPADGLATSAAETAAGRPIQVEAIAESVTAGSGGGIRISGTVAFDWVAPCRRCLDAVHDRTVVEFSELFQRDPVDPDDVLPLDDDLVDLEPVVRELVLSALPLAPLCSSTCAGPEPARFPTGPDEGPSDEESAIDPRWAALSELDLDR